MPLPQLCGAATGAPTCPREGILGHSGVFRLISRSTLLQFALVQTGKTSPFYARYSAWFADLLKLPGLVAKFFAPPRAERHATCKAAGREG